MESKQSNDSGHPKIELHKASIEYAKFLVSLSTGSIVLLASFLDNLTKDSDWVLLAGVSLVAFMLSVISGVILYTTLLWHLGEEMSDKGAVALVFSTIGSWLFFLVAVINLTVFAVKNLI